VVAGDIDEIRVGEVEVIAGDTAREVVSEAEGEVEAVEAAGDERVEITVPEVFVVVPVFVFDFAAEGAGDAADFVGGRFFAGFFQEQAEERFVAGAHAFGEIEESVDVSPGIGGGDEQGIGSGEFAGGEAQALGSAERGCRAGKRRRGFGCFACGHDEEGSSLGPAQGFEDFGGGVFCDQRLAEFFRGAAHGFGGRDGIGWVEKDVDLQRLCGRGCFAETCGSGGRAG
jgi:hypothetical protein